MVETCSSGDKLFRSGFVRHSRLHRVVLRLSTLQEIFEMILSEAPLSARLTCIA